MKNILDVREELLKSIEGGQFHAREKIKQASALPYEDFLGIGLALKACFANPQLHETLIARLRQHADVIIGVLPPGIQDHGLLPAEHELVDQGIRVPQLHEISDQQLRRWIIDDGSLVYGELDRKELQSYFEAIAPLVQPDSNFIDLGSGLGKVVVTAGLHLPFATCRGVEIVPYRHRMAFERFLNVIKLAQGLLQQMEAPTQPEDVLELSWTNSLRVSHLLNLPKRVSYQLGDMFAADIKQADLIFIYSTCFGSFIHKLAHKLATEAPEGCLVTTTTYAMNHPGLELIKVYPAKSMAWTDVFIYRRTGKGPWPEVTHLPSYQPNLDEWEGKARELLRLTK